MHFSLHCNFLLRWRCFSAVISTVINHLWTNQLLQWLVKNAYISMPGGSFNLPLHIFGNLGSALSNAISHFANGDFSLCKIASSAQFGHLMRTSKGFLRANDMAYWSFTRFLAMLTFLFLNFECGCQWLHFNWNTQSDWCNWVFFFGVITALQCSAIHAVTACYVDACTRLCNGREPFGNEVN